MQIPRGSGVGNGSLGSAAIVIAGLVVTVTSAYLLVNPGALPNFFYLPYFVRVVPLLFTAVVALLAPQLILAMALVVMFGGPEMTRWAKALLPISPFWVLLALATAALIARNIRQHRAVPWNESIVMVLLIAGAAIYELQDLSLSTHGLLLPWCAGFALVTSGGLLREWRPIISTIGALHLAFFLLELQLIPFLVPGWGTFGGVLRTGGAGESTLRQATSLEWLFSAIALLALGIAVRAPGRWRLVLWALFTVFAASSILTFSRGAFLGLGAGILALVCVEKRGRGLNVRLLLVAGLTVYAIGLYSGAWSYSFEYRGLDLELQRLEAGVPGRLTLLIRGLREMPGRWLVGSGQAGSPAHSSFVDIWNIYGGVYALGLWAFLLHLLRRSYRMAVGARVSSPWSGAIPLGLFCSFVGSLAVSVVDPTFFSLGFATVFWVMRGLEIAIWRSGLATSSGVLNIADASTPIPAASDAQPGD